MSDNIKKHLKLVDSVLQMNPDFELKTVRLYNCDNMKFMKNISDNFYELAIVDPPYGIDIAIWDSSIPTKEYFDELFRISKNQIIWGGNYFDLPHTEGWICWDKTFNDDIKGGKLTKGGCPRDKMSDFELIWTSFKQKAKMLRFTQIGNLMGFNGKIRVDYQHKKKIHPTQKHIALYKKLLYDYTNKGDKIIDTHGGSMSSGCAAMDMGFEMDICEIDKEYFDNAVERLKNNVQEYFEFA